MTTELEALHKEAVQKIGYMPDIKYWLIRAYDLGEKAHHQDMMREVKEWATKEMDILLDDRTEYDVPATEEYKRGYATALNGLKKHLTTEDMSELDQDCPYCDIHSCCSIHADNQNKNN